MKQLPWLLLLFVSSNALSQIELTEIVDGLSGITSITNAGDDRLFITEQSGRIRIYDGTQILATPFLDISGSISSGGERGLLSIAFHPDYGSGNRFFFANFTNPAGDTVIARFEVSAGNPNVADAGSRRDLLTIDQDFSNHNGGQVVFGPDGFLYIGMGDGGSGDDPNCRAQDPNSLLGKILRIDVDRNVSVAPFHGIPAGNPFLGNPGVRDEIWALGVRNPWRFNFDRETGDMIIADVGQNAWEEISFQPATSLGGENYGWKLMEGDACGNGGTNGCVGFVPAPCMDPSYTDPVIVYPHLSGCNSITGGYVYRGNRIPSLRGKYVYGDVCRSGGTMWAAPTDTWVVETLPFTFFPRTFGEDVNGELYVASGNTIFQFTQPCDTTFDFWLEFWETNPNDGCFNETITVIDLLNLAFPVD